MSLSTCLLKAWALASARSREAGNEEGWSWGRGWEGVVQALHAISFTICLNGAERF